MVSQEHRHFFNELSNQIYCSCILYIIGVNIHVNIYNYIFIASKSLICITINAIIQSITELQPHTHALITIDIVYDIHVVL